MLSPRQIKKLYHTCIMISKLLYVSIKMQIAKFPNFVTKTSKTVDDRFPHVFRRLPRTTTLRYVICITYHWTEYNNCCHAFPEHCSQNTFCGCYCHLSPVINGDSLQVFISPPAIKLLNAVLSDSTKCVKSREICDSAKYVKTPEIQDSRNARNLVQSATPRNARDLVKPVIPRNA